MENNYRNTFQDHSSCFVAELEGNWLFLVMEFETGWSASASADEDLSRVHGGGGCLRIAVFVFLTLFAFDGRRMEKARCLATLVFNFVLFTTHQVRPWRFLMAESSPKLI